MPYTEVELNLFKINQARANLEGQYLPDSEITKVPSLEEVKKITENIRRMKDVNAAFFVFAEIRQCLTAVVHQSAAERRVNIPFDELSLSDNDFELAKASLELVELAYSMILFGQNVMLDKMKRKRDEN
jgi:hypothetical protein